MGKSLRLNAVQQTAAMNWRVLPIAHFAEQRFARIAFYGKVMEWHTRWTAQSRPVFHLTVYRWAWLKRLHTVVSARAASALAAQALPPGPPVDTGRAHATP